MKKLLLITALIPAMIIIAGCSRAISADEHPSLIEDAQMAIETGDYESARKICDKLIDGAKTEEMTASTLGRVAIIYMQISDDATSDDYTVNAYQCYRNSFKVNPDSARAFYSGINGDDARFVHMLEAIVKQVDNPNKNNIEDHEQGAAAFDSIAR